MVFGDQPAASCLYRPELAGAQQVMDELPGDAQWFSGLVRTVGEPLNQALRAEISRTRASRSSRMSVASSRAIAFVLSSAGPRPPARRCPSPLRSLALPHSGCGGGLLHGRVAGVGRRRDSR